MGNNSRGGVAEGVHTENLFQLLIFSMDFFFKVFIICARLKQSVGQIRFCLASERRFDHEKSCFFTDHCVFFSWLYR